MDPTNRTFVCSVLFLDIVEYSRRSVAEQMLLKQRFNALLGKALQRIAVDDRIVLDTGDGAAVSFLGNPEDTLFVSTSLRDAIAGDQPGDPAHLSLRLGINLGPVRLIKDLNGQPNIIGDGINVAQRVMSFAKPGQILVSRSYYEVVSRLDPQFSQVFHYEGARTDKHVREHEVYGVGLGTPRWGAFAGDSRGLREDSVSPARSRRLYVALPTTMALILATGIGVRLQRDTPAQQPFPVANEKAVPMLITAHAEVPNRTAAKPPAVRTAVVPGPAPRQIVEKTEKAGPTDEPAAAMLFVVPWGEVIVDGKSRGVTPPLRQLELPPGRHKIEIRNTSFPSHAQTVTVRAGEKITIRHRFN
jgi:class 3 adenylate cyclase